MQKSPAFIHRVSRTCENPRRRLLAAITLACSVPFALAAPPTWTAPGPVRLVVPYAPGGGTDVLARIVVNQIGNDLGQPLIVENRPGVNGIMGANYVYASPPNGTTLLFAAADFRCHHTSTKKPSSTIPMVSSRLRWSAQWDLCWRPRARAPTGPASSPGRTAARARPPLAPSAWPTRAPGAAPSRRRSCGRCRPGGLTARRSAGALAVAAGEATVSVPLRAARGRLALEHLPDEVDATARPSSSSPNSW